VTLGNVKTLIHRGKAALARELAPSGSPAPAHAKTISEVHNREVLCM
jgi:hypothetical protein